MTGAEIERVLVEHVQKHPSITLYENHLAIDLITQSTRMKRGMVTTTHEDICCGAYVLDRTSRRVKRFSARIIMLATGGAGKVYLYTSNPDIATGDGIAMAYRAGATNCQHGVCSVPPHLPFSSGSQKLFDLRSRTRGRRGSDRCVWHAVHGKV